ncbi:MAG TPA: FAD:protein FMN transferase [Flavobacterium sp.]|uniref:FAD:protein FMN transferase n=1 Tax=Flavobacterium sp. TaxID=239 RepID=UPI002C26C3C5|nr:FAD:protein FMN transferase [Flavobacterium sp.]HNP32521.1 FAD:protein FMN transferase [Flavobacterium sp.]
MKKIILLYCIFPIYNLTYSQIEPTIIEGEAQGTTYHITYYDELNRNLQPEISMILVDFDKSVSTYVPNSIISRINTNDGDIKIDKYFKVCFKKAKEIWKATNGAFDPTVYPITNAWGFGPGKKQTIEKKKIDSILNFVGFDLIKIRGNRVVKKDPRVQLDFNAFAQGYSVDVISDFLTKKGIKSFIVEIGGEVYAKGKQPNGDFWTVGIEKPIDNKESQNPLEATVKLENLAIATSGNYRRFVIENGVKYVHHIDPKTGYPTKNNLLSASIFSKQCITSDATATGILVMGFENAKKYFAAHPEIEAFLIYSDEKGDYKTYETPGLKSILAQNK